MHFPLEALKSATYSAATLQVWEPNPLNFRTVQGCCGKIEKIEAKQSREKLNSADRGSRKANYLPLPHSHTSPSHRRPMLTHILPTLKSVPSLRLVITIIIATLRTVFLPFLPSSADKSSSSCFIPLFFESGIKALATFR